MPGNLTTKHKQDSGDSALTLKVSVPLSELSLGTMQVHSVKKGSLLIEASAENLPLGQLVLKTQDPELIALARKDEVADRKNPDRDPLLSMDRVEEGIRDGKFQISFPDLDPFIEK